MPWGYVAGAVVSDVASSALSPSNSGSAAGAADPFASQRGQYQSPLATLMNQNSTQGGATQYNPNISALATNAGIIGSNNATAVQAGQGTNAAQNQMIALMQGGTAGANALAATPGYQFALDQGVQATDRSAAAKGTLGSGQEMAELTQYGQGLATQTLNSTMTNLSNENTALSNSQNTGLQAMGSAASEFSGLNAATANNYSNAYQQLAQLSGANSGQPGVAGQLQQQGQANASAFGQQVGSALGNYVNSGSTSTNAGAYNGQDVNAVGGNTSVYGNYGNNASGDAINIGYGGT